MVLYRRSRRTLLELSIMIDPPFLESLLFLRVLWLLLVALTKPISMYAFVNKKKNRRFGPRWSLPTLSISFPGD